MSSIDEYVRRQNQKNVDADAIAAAENDERIRKLGLEDISERENTRREISKYELKLSELRSRQYKVFAGKWDLSPYWARILPKSFMVTNKDFEYHTELMRGSRDGGAPRGYDIVTYKGMESRSKYGVGGIAPASSFLLVYLSQVHLSVPQSLIEDTDQRQQTVKKIMGLKLQFQEYIDTDSGNEPTVRVNSQ